MENRFRRTDEPVGDASDDYKASVRRMIKSEVDKVLEEELRKASRELMEEQRKAIRQAVDEQRQIIREVLEEEKHSIRLKMDDLRRSLGKIASA
jgi:CHASE3 domain sensor protein